MAIVNRQSTENVEDCPARRTGPTILRLALLWLVALPPPAGARNGHHRGFGGHSGGGGTHGGAVAGDRRYANDDNVKAAAEDEDKLFDSKVKSICRSF